MSDHDDRLAQLALALADGTPIDWAAAESSAVSESERQQIRDLRIVWHIASGPNIVAPPLPTGDDWGPLRIIEPIGHGRFGDVYRAWDRRLDREVALKLLRRRESDDRDAGSGVVEEGRLLARVRHPNVVTVYGAERINGRVGVWMELVHGKTLEDALANGPLRAEDAAAIGADVARALEAVHAAGLIHRDVKAQNVMRDDTARVVLMDFGTGQDLGFERAPELAGTPLYLAPEVLDGAAATPRSDVYSVGVLVFHLATGTFPIDGRTVAEVRAAHRRDDQSPARVQFCARSPALAAIVDRALAASPDARFETAGELAGALEAFRPASAPARVARRWTRWRAVAALGLVTAGVGAAWVLGRSSPRRNAPAKSTNDAPVVMCDDCSMLGDPSISVDGHRLAFVDSRTFDLTIRNLDSGSVTPLGLVPTPSASPPLPALPALSPDGRQIAFLWMSNDVAELRTASSLERGSTHRLIGDPDVGAIPLGWSADGRSVLAQVQRSTGGADLDWVSVPDGVLTVIARLALPQERVTASVSADGRWIAYASLPQERPGQPSPASRPLVIIPSTGGPARRVTTSEARESHPIWSGDGAHLVFVSDVSGTSDLWSIDVANGAPTGATVLIRKDLGAAIPVRLTAQERLFLYEHHDGIAESFIAPLASRPAGSANPSRLLGSYPTWSPDGSAIALLRRAPGTPNGRTVVVRTLNTGQEREYRHAGLGGEPALWFGDSKSLLVRIIEDAREFWYRIDPGDGRFVKLIPNRGNPRFLTHKDVRALAPDGRTLYFGAYANESPNSSLNRVVAADLTTGTYRDVLTLPGTVSTWPASAAELALAISPDGQTLAVQTVDPTTSLTSLWTVAVDGRGLRRLCEPLGAPDDVAERLQWTRDGRFVVFTTVRMRRDTNHGPSFRVMRVPASGGTPTFTGFEMDGWLYNFDLNPNGSQIVFFDAATTGSRDGIWAIDLPTPRRVH